MHTLCPETPYNPRVSRKLHQISKLIVKNEEIVGISEFVVVFSVPLIVCFSNEKFHVTWDVV